MGIRLRVRSSWTQSGGEAVYEFDQGRVVIGRGSGADVRLPHPAVSTTHATVRVQGTSYVLVDEGATNGTHVNGQRLAPGRPKGLRTGDRITVGGFRITLEVGLPVAQVTSVEHTSALARQMVREILGAEGDSVTSPTLIVANGPLEGHQIELPAPPARLVVGRGESCDLSLADGDASREHAEITRDLDGVVVRDLDSKNGLFVNDRPVRERRLRDRDEVRVGATWLRFEDPAEARLRSLEEEPDVAYELVDAAPDLEVGATGEAKAEDTAASMAPEDTSEREVARARKRQVELSTDLFIYVLAALVLAASLAGLVLLLRSG